jgi:hypothetical protein
MLQAHVSLHGVYVLPSRIFNPFVVANGPGMVRHPATQSTGDASGYKASAVCDACSENKEPARKKAVKVASNTRKIKKIQEKVNRRSYSRK